MREKVCPFHLNTIEPLYVSVAQSYGMLNNGYKALLYLEKALTASEQLSMNTNLELLIAIIYQTQAKIYEGMRKWKELGEAIEKALEIKKKLLEANHPSLGFTYTLMGNYYFLQSKYSRALAEYKKVENILKQLPKHNYLKIEVSANIATTLSHLNKNKKALEIFKNIEHNYPQVANNIITFYEEMGKIYMKLEDYRKARQYFELGRKVRKDAKSLDYKMHYFHNIATLYYYIGDYKKSLLAYCKSLKEKRKKLDSEDLEIATSIQKIGEIHLLQGREDKAEECLNQALNFRVKFLNEDHLDIATTCEYLAQLYLKQKRYLKVISISEKVETIYNIRTDDFFQKNVKLSVAKANIINAYIKGDSLSKELIRHIDDLTSDDIYTKKDCLEKFKEIFETANTLHMKSCCFWNEYYQKEL